MWKISRPLAKTIIKGDWCICLFFKLLSDKNFSFSSPALQLIGMLSFFPQRGISPIVQHRVQGQLVMLLLQRHSSALLWGQLWCVLNNPDLYHHNHPIRVALFWLIGSIWEHFCLSLCLVTVCQVKVILQRMRGKLIIVSNRHIDCLKGSKLIHLNNWSKVIYMIALLPIYEQYGYWSWFFSPSSIVQFISSTIYQIL